MLGCSHWSKDFSPHFSSSYALQQDHKQLKGKSITKVTNAKMLLYLEQMFIVCDVKA